MRRRLGQLSATAPHRSPGNATAFDDVIQKFGLLTNRTMHGWRQPSPSRRGTPFPARIIFRLLGGK